MLGSRTLAETVSLLMSRPTCGGIAQHLVLGVMRDHSARAAVISIYGSDGSLSEVGMFGLSPVELVDVRCLSLTDHTPLTDAARTGEPVVLLTTERVTLGYPWRAAQKGPVDPMVAWPLKLPDEVVGALQLTFTRPPDEASLREDLSGIGPVLSLYLSLLAQVDRADAVQRAQRLSLVRSGEL